MAKLNNTIKANNEYRTSHKSNLLKTYLRGLEVAELKEDDEYVKNQNGYTN